jgi:hypothetical protein
MSEQLANDLTDKDKRSSTSNQTSTGQASLILNPSGASAADDEDLELKLALEASAAEARAMGLSLETEAASGHREAKVDSAEESSCMNDLLIAQTLQMQFDKEFDDVRTLSCVIYVVIVDTIFMSIKGAMLNPYLCLLKELKKIYVYFKVLKKEEAAANRGSKVSVSYSKYRVIPDNALWEDSDDEEEDPWLVADDRRRHVDWYETADKEMGALPR